MMQPTSFTQALGLLATAPLAFAQPATSSHEVVESQDMFARDSSIELRPGWPWDATHEDAFSQLQSSSTLGANVACQSDTPLGAGPVPSPDTAAAFSAYTPFSGNATANGVNGTAYTVVTVNSNGAAIPTSSDTTPIQYLGWVNMASYSASSCASLCAAYGTGSTCQSFNIYYLRSPTVAPSFDSSCPNPSSMTNIVCALFGGATSSTNMVNYGQFRGQFQVVIAGSNNYNVTYDVSTINLSHIHLDNDGFSIDHLTLIHITRNDLGIIRFNRTDLPLIDLDSIRLILFYLICLTYHHVGLTDVDHHDLSDIKHLIRIDLSRDKYDVKVDDLIFHNSNEWYNSVCHFNYR